MTYKSVNEIMSHIFRNYPAKGYNYSITVDGGGVHEDMNRDIAFNCSQIGTAGLNFQISQTKKYGIGNPYNMPVGRSYTEVTATFYESEKEKEREYFVEWQNKIFNKTTKRFAFFKDYVKTLTFTQYSKSGKETYKCKLLDVFPSNISPLDKSYANEGISQFNVSFQYYDVEEIFLDVEQGERIFPI